MMADEASLELLASRLASSPGLTGKQDILPVVQTLGISDADAIRVGDDTAAIPCDGGWNLFACEAMLPAFVEQKPWFAGFSALWVNVSDIQAMGGRAIAVVDALWATDAGYARPLLEGLRAASELTGIPVVGGHANLQAPHAALSVSVLGFARRLMTSFDARPGDVLVAAIDLRGRQHAPWPFWDAASDAPTERIRSCLQIMPELAESGLCRAAKDISQGGIIGTSALFAESSRVGMSLDIDAIPRPDDQSLEQWLCTFPSFGYLMAMPRQAVTQVLPRFRQQGVSAAVIGSVDDTGELAIQRRGQRALVRDLRRQPLTGCAALQTSETNAPAPNSHEHDGSPSTPHPDALHHSGHAASDAPPNLTQSAQQEG